MNVNKMLEATDPREYAQAEETMRRIMAVCESCASFLDQVDMWFGDTSEVDSAIESGGDLDPDTVTEIYQNGDLVFEQLEKLICEARDLAALKPQQKLLN